MMSIMEWITQPITIGTILILSVIAIIAVMLYLDKRQEEEIEIIEHDLHWQFEAIMVLAKEIYKDEVKIYDQIAEEYEKK